MRRTPLIRLVHLAIVILGCVIVLTACSGPKGVVSAPKGSGNTIGQALNKLGVNTTTSPRKSPTGTDLPSSFSPLGATIAYKSPAVGSTASAMHATKQVLFMGASLQSSPLSGCEATHYPQGTLFGITGAGAGGGTIVPGTATSLDTFAFGCGPLSSTTPDTQGNSLFQSLRSVASGDLDGTGSNELAIAYVAPPAVAGNDPTLKLTVIQDAKGNFSTTTSTLMDAKNVTDVAVTTGDFTGDGTSTPVIALAYANQQPGELLFLKGKPGSYQVDSSLAKTFPSTLAGGSMYFRFAAGSVDYDRADELAMVVGQFAFSTRVSSGTASYYVYDDANHNFSLMTSGPVTATNSDGTFSAKSADISLGDINGDGINDIVVGGPTSFVTACGTDYTQFAAAIEYAAPRKFKTLGTEDLLTLAIPNCTKYLYPPALYFTFINTLDLTGNGIDSIVQNEYVYDYNPSTCPNRLCLRQGKLSSPVIPAKYFFPQDFSHGSFPGALSPTSTTMAVGDVTGDGRQDLVMYMKWTQLVRVWGQSQDTSVGNGGWAQLSSVPVVKPPYFYPPELVTTMTKPSGPVLKFVSHQLVFTQPIVIAAVFAPPCEKGIGQNLGACNTEFAKSTSSGNSQSLSLSVSAGITVGYTAEEGGSNEGIKATQQVTKSIDVTTTLSTAHSYTLTKTVGYTTGNMADGVVFTSIPEDEYVYKVVSSSSSSDVGKFVELFVPRTPITLIADRSFYNSVIPNNELKIDSRVFKHTVGDVSTYPTQAPAGALENGPTTVAEGATKSSQLGITVSNKISLGGSLGISYTKSMQFTVAAGVPDAFMVGGLAGFSVGYSATASMTVSSGHSTSYTGTVGGIPSSVFSNDYYNWGVDAYKQTLDGQTFEVVNYWVPPK